MTVVASNYERKDRDLYETEAWAVHALLRHFPIHNLPWVWEPAAGNHAIADVLRGHCGVSTSDIATYDRAHDFEADFFEDRIFNVPAGIITNPPYGKGNRDAVRFAELALQRCDGLVALLLTAKFDFGKTRTHLFRDNPRFAGKVTLIDRIQWFPGKSTGTEDHAWYIWKSIQAKHHHTPTIYYEGKTPKGDKQCTGRQN
jgi:hypothetical protein